LSGDTGGASWDRDIVEGFVRFSHGWSQSTDIQMSWSDPAREKSVAPVLPLSIRLKERAGNHKTNIAQNNNGHEKSMRRAMIKPRNIERAQTI